MSNRFLVVSAAATAVLVAHVFQSPVILALAVLVLCSPWLPTSIIGPAFLITSTVIALLSNQYASTAASAPFYVTGRNNTALFVVSDGHGLTNVHMATAQSLLERHPDIQLHFITFPNMKSKITRLSNLAKKRQPRAKDVMFHAITSGRPYLDAMNDIHFKYVEGGLLSVIVPPGFGGVESFVSRMGKALAPWKPEEHLAIYNQICDFIDHLDPAIILLDTIFAPGIEATRGRNRMHAFTTANAVVNNFPHFQPYGKMFWKYPALASGFPYPVPWRLIPANIYLNTKIIYTFLTMSGTNSVRAFLRSHGIVDPINLMGLHRPEIPWITQSTPGAMIPVDVVPRNVTCTGPIVLSSASAEEVDPELVGWMKQAPTVLINLGSSLTYSIQQTEQMISAIEKLLEISDLQFLWKYNISPPIASTYDWRRALTRLTDTGRVRVSSWLVIDPPALLQSGHITTFVTHGGSGAYHEAIEAGVPMVVLPMWTDQFNFARLTEQIGVGLWACRETSPHYDASCLSAAIMRLSNGGQESTDIRAKVKEVGDRVSVTPGRDVAADIVARLATLQMLEVTEAGLCHLAKG